MEDLEKKIKQTEAIIVASKNGGCLRTEKFLCRSCLSRDIERGYIWSTKGRGGSSIWLCILAFAKVCFMSKKGVCSHCYY